MTARIVVLGFDAMDPNLAAEMIERGRLPALASLWRDAGHSQVRNPPGLFVGSLWSTFFTARSAARTGFHCWIEVPPGSYELRLTSADSIRGTPFWEHLSGAGRRVAVLDVPHSRAGAPLHGVQVSEWGCHDRHFGLRSHPPELAEQLVARHGLHPVLGADPWSVREWAPDDYVFRAGPLRTGEEETDLLAGMLDGAQRKLELSRDLLASEPWDLFLSVFGEPHSIGHQSWHVHDPRHPRHDPALRARLGDPLERVYEAMDGALAAHLQTLDEDTIVMVLLSHGMAPHYDGTHLLPEILRRLHRADAGQLRRPRHARLLTRLWYATPGAARRKIAPALRRRLAGLSLSPAREDETEAERRSQVYFMAPNNFVVGGVRINLRGREPAGMVNPGLEFEAVCDRLAADLLAIVDVRTGAPLIRAVERSSDHYERDPQDTLPDLFLEWNHDGPVETIWSPRFGMINGTYEHWRTGDHRPGGLVLVRAPGVRGGAPLDPVAIEDLGPTIATALGVELPDVDGRPAAWTSQLRGGGASLAGATATAVAAQP